MTNPIIQTWQQAVVVATANVLNIILGFIPSLIGAILVFWLGLWLSNFLQKIVVSALSAVKFEKLSKILKLDGFLKKADWKINASQLTGQAVRWIVVFIFLVAAVNLLGLTTISVVLGNLLGYVPRVLSAVLVLYVISVSSK